jgi:hypothetical protein
VADESGIVQQVRILLTAQHFIRMENLEPTDREIMDRYNIKAEPPKPFEFNGL